MKLEHHYNRETGEMEYRFSVWPRLAFETMPRVDWSDFLGQVIGGHIESTEPLLDELEIERKHLSFSALLDLNLSIDELESGLES
mgnify:CR=1 FL=1|tara:strand:+ start:249 stop:503 length:255 start_codon:yes stop_codon:yes gene_type:complete